jgi:hypothetical protein
VSINYNGPILRVSYLAVPSVAIGDAPHPQRILTPPSLGLLEKSRPDRFVLFPVVLASSHGRDSATPVLVPLA